MATRSRLTADLAVGSRVTVTGKKGVIKFIGPTEFAIGDWIGVELDSAEGKNDGTINGVQYFEGREGHGLFVKRAQVRLDRGVVSSTASRSPTRKANPSAPSTPAVAPARPSSRLAAIREKNKALKESLAVGKFSPDRQRHHSDGFLSGLRSPSIDSARGGGNVPGNVPGSPASIVSIGSVGSASRRNSQSMTRGRRDVAVTSPRASGFEAAEADSQKSSNDTPSSTARNKSTGIPNVPARRGVQAAERRSPELASPSQEQSTSGFSLPRSVLPPPPPRIMEQHDVDGEVKELRAKASEAASEAEDAKTRCAEAVAMLDASEACCRDLEGQLSLLRRKSENALGEERSKASTIAKEKAAAAAAGRREADLESQLAELSDACEALTLDKEHLALEKEDLQEKVDELQVELDSAKLEMEHAQLSAKENENAARALSAARGVAGDGGVDVKLLAEQNLQLKEALKRLHTHSITEKSDLTKAVRVLEKDAVSSATLQEELRKLRSWKENKAIEIEDLMEKLDESKAYEEMVEALTSKNLELGERCGELEATIADLESSVELSEELESQQAEEIRELQSELTGREVSLHNQKLALESMVKELGDTKQTIDRFREYAEQLKTSRDELAAASTQDDNGGALSSAEKRSLLAQKASIERMATETRRAKVAERLLQVDLLDARARSSRLSMLLPGSLLLAETELRCTEVDLSVCRLAGKASLALELLEVPAVEFVDALAESPGDVSSSGGDTQASPTLDRAAALEDCTRLALEAEQSLPIAQAVGESLTVLDCTVLATSRSLSSHEIAAISAEVASAVTEAEGLIDGLLQVIQDEGGLPPTGSASTISALLVTTQSIGKRRIAAVASGTTADGSGSTQAGYRQHIGAAVTALQDCLVCARRAVLATTGAILRDVTESRVSTSVFIDGEGGHVVLWKTVRGLWGDLMNLRSTAYADSGSSRSAELEEFALGTKKLYEKICAHCTDARRSAPAAAELAKQVASLRLTAKDLARSPVGRSTEDGTSVRPPCPEALWRAVAPSLARSAPRSASGPGDAELSADAPCVSRAEMVRASLERAIDLQPELEAAKAYKAEVTLELAARSKELVAAISKTEQLESLVEKAQGSQAASADLQKQIAHLQDKSNKFEQENKFMAEALEDLQDSTSRIEAENRVLKLGASPTGRTGSTSNTSTSKSVRSRSTRNTGNSPDGDEHASDASWSDGGSKGCTPAGKETEESLTVALKASKAEVARWRGKVFASILSGLEPLPRLSHARDVPRGGETTTHSPGVFTLASESLNELVLLSKKLDFVRDPPRVVRVRGAASRESSRLETPQVAEDGGEATRGVRTPHIDTSLISSSAGAAWQAQQVLDSRLKREWREGQGRAAEALYSLVDSDRGGSRTFREGTAANLPKRYSHRHPDPGNGGNLRVARLRLPSEARLSPFEVEKASVPITLERSSFMRLQRALAV